MESRKNEKKSDSKSSGKTRGGKRPLQWPFHRFSEPAEQRRLKRGEAVAQVTVDLLVGKHDGDRRTFGDCRHVKFWMFNTPESGTNTLMAAVLLNAWQMATGMKFTDQSIAELSKVAADNGWIATEDLSSHLKRSTNKGGRPLGTIAEETRQYVELWEQHTRETKPATVQAERAVIAKIARQTFPGRVKTADKMRLHEIKVGRALERQNLIVSRPPSPKKQSEKNPR
jgi:hypothetical protein